MKKTSRKNKTVEKQIQTEIIQTLRLSRVSVYRVNVGLFETKYGGRVRTGVPNGFPDLFGFKWDDGKVFFIEVKKPKHYRISPAQMAFHQDLMHHHVIHGIAKSTQDALKIVNDNLVGYGYPDTEVKDWY